MERRDETKMKKAFARDSRFASAGPSHEAAMLKQHDHMQKVHAYTAFKNKQQDAMDRRSLQAESERLRAHLQTHRLHGNHGVIARLANLRRILGQVNDPAA